jgi:hypothetical protein
MCDALCSGRLSRLAWLVIAWAICILLCAQGRADLLSVIAPDALVVAGSKAAPQELGVAREISEALRAAGGPSDNFALDQDVRDSLELAGYRHLILVGTHESNSALAKCWGHFAAYPSAPWRTRPAPTDTFFVFGFGDFRGDDVGAVECDQNPYWRKVISVGLPDPGFRLLVRLTGSGPAGVCAAARAFLDCRLLGGVLPGASGWESVSDLWSICAAQADTKPPLFLTQAGVETAQHRIEYVGWLMPDSTVYAGLRELGVEPARVHRAKYVTEQGLCKFDAAFHRRASANELLAVLAPSPEDAAKRLRAGLGGESAWRAVTDGLWRGPKDTYIGRLGDYVIVESFDEPWGDLAMKALGTHAAEAVAPSACEPS